MINERIQCVAPPKVSIRLYQGFFNPLDQSLPTTYDHLRLLTTFSSDQVLHASTSLHFCLLIPPPILHGLVSILPSFDCSNQSHQFYLRPLTTTTFDSDQILLASTFPSIFPPNTSSHPHVPSLSLPSPPSPSPSSSPSSSSSLIATRLTRPDQPSLRPPRPWMSRL